MFNMEIDETMLASEFKAELAKKLVDEAGMDPNEVTWDRLRVREMAQGKWIGNVFMDDESLLEPVKQFNGSEKFAFNLLSEGPEPRQKDQAVITLFKFQPSSSKCEFLQRCVYLLHWFRTYANMLHAVLTVTLNGEWKELLVDDNMTTEQLRERIAALDPDIMSPRNVSLATATEMKKNHYLRELNGTVWDMQLLNFDWDRKGSLFNRTTTLFGVKDMDCYYYCDATEEQMELTTEQEETLKKRAMIEKRKKANGVPSLLSAFCVSLACATFVLIVVSSCSWQEEVRRG